MKQDLNGARSAQDLERKYNLRSISSIKKAVENTEKGLNKTNTELEKFVESVVKIDDKVNKTILSVDVFYALGESETEAPEEGWTTQAPKWEDSKYMWQKTVTTFSNGIIKESSPTCISGANGKDGEQGPKGDKGDPGSAGNGIESISYYYATSTTQTPPPASSITSLTIPILSATDKYLWQKEVIDFSDPNVVDKTTVILLAVYGDQGTQGDKGDKGDKGDTGNDGTSVTITSTSITYQASMSGTTTPTGTWSVTVPSVNNGEYLWTKTVVNYSDGKSTTAYSVAYKGTNGAKGEQGIGINEIIEQYYLSTSDSIQTGGSWIEEQPNWIEETYIWTRSKIIWSDKTISYTDPVLANFFNDTNENLSDLSKKVSTKITTWYYSGVPTLLNEPANDWTDDEQKSEHLGDLYYDKDTGYAYRFSYDETNKYSWVRITDSDVIEALALANAASDTADSKRRVFTQQPIPPYDNGDLWIKDMEIYICQISKPIGEYFDENDFIIATKYTDDTLASEVNGKLEIVAGQVTTITKTANDLNIEFVRQQEVFDELNNKVVNVEGILEDMSFNFSTKGLHVGTTLDPNNSLLDNTGIKVYNYNKLNAIFNNNGSGIDKLIVTGTAQLGYLKFVKSTKNGQAVTKIFHLKNLVQDLEDLL